MRFLKLRRALIDMLAGEDISVIINTTVYDYVIEANELIHDNHVIKRNKVVSLDRYVDKETARRMNLAKQGVSKMGNAYVLTNPSLREI